MDDLSGARIPADLGRGPVPCCTQWNARKPSGSCRVGKADSMGPGGNFVVRKVRLDGGIPSCLEVASQPFSNDLRGYPRGHAV